MQVVLQLAGAATMPVGAFAFLLWMARLEDTLPADVRRAQRQPDPPPILAIPVRTRQLAPTPAPANEVSAAASVEAVTPPVVPEQRLVPAPELSGTDAAVAT